MDKIIIISLIFLLSLSLNLKAQVASISGKARFEKSLTVAESVKVDLLDSVKTILKTVYTNKGGAYGFTKLPLGNYQVQATSQEGMLLLIRNIQLGLLEKLSLDLNIPEPCANQQSTNICPFCNSHKKVLKISPGRMVSKNFGGNISAMEKYEKKIRKRGYETYVTNEGEKIVISMYLETEKEKFLDFCHHWFCEKCKKIF